MAAYDIVFNGELIDGFAPEAVKARFARAFQLSADKVDAIFSHPCVVLRRDLPAADAGRYVDLLAKAGMRASMRPSGDPATVEAVPEAAAAEAVPEAAAAEAPAEGFEFTGNGGEYFRIWIVNVLLTIVTLGIYSAWAKVRTERYFYGNTRLDGAAFEYLAEPMAILKGRIVAVAVFAAVTFAPPEFAVPATLLLVLVMPWVVSRALAFRARHSAWRNVRFGFDGGAGGAYLAFLVWPLLGTVTLGLLMPLALQRQQRYIIGNSRYGRSPFTYSAGVRDYVSALLRLSLRLFGGFLGAGAVILLLAQAVPAVAALLPLLIIAVYLVGFAAFNVMLSNLRFGFMGIAGHRFSGDYTIASFLRLLVGNSLLVAVTAGFYYPWAKVRTARYKAEHVGFLPAGDLDGFVVGEQTAATAVGEELGDAFDVEFGF